MVRISILVLIFLISGCASTNLKTYDKTGFPINISKDITFKTKIETGIIKSGHSDWIKTSEFEAGKEPQFFCANKQRHSWNGQLWMFDLKSQNTVLENLNSVLTSNGVYDESSPNELVIHFERIAQGKNDQPVYTFHLNVSLAKDNQVIYSKQHHIVGNNMDEEFWASDSWSGAKKRATNRVISAIVSDLNRQLSIINI